MLMIHIYLDPTFQDDPMQKCPIGAPKPPQESPDQVYGCFVASSVASVVH